MLDFASALYLGLRHASRELAPWEALTTGTPAALRRPPGSVGVARALARLSGCQGAVLGPSTLHLLWDYCGTLDPARSALLLDAGAYAIARWGAERARARGIPVRSVGHYDPAAVREELARLGRRRPVLLCDGWCPRCGQVAPLGPYLELLVPRGGELVVDDTQALGLLGGAPTTLRPYGRGGGGSPSWRGVRGAPELVVIASLAKGLGVPLAVLAGTSDRVEDFVGEGETRSSCSPPSAAHIAAATRALAVNAAQGEELRRRLGARVHQLVRGLRLLGLQSTGGLFPVQAVQAPPGIDPSRWQARLLRWGVRGVLVGSRESAPRLALLLSARHTPRQVRLALAGLAQTLRELGATSSVAGARS